MTECTSKKPITTKQIITQMSGMIIGILTATFIEKQGYPWIGWSVAGLFIALGIQFAYVSPEKRWTFKNISITILTIIVCSVVYNLIRILEM